MRAVIRNDSHPLTQPQGVGMTAGRSITYAARKASYGMGLQHSAFSTALTALERQRGPCDWDKKGSQCTPETSDGATSRFARAPGVVVVLGSV